MKREKYIELLGRYVPEGCAEWATDFIAEYQVHLKISKPRQTKLGDYRSPYQNKGHRISVNVNLNKYAFFITLVHEFAHLLTWEDHQRKVAPHGKEWKTNFKNLLLPFTSKHIFPEDVQMALEKYLSNPSASSCTDASLMKVLHTYDAKSNAVLLESLPVDSIFKTPNGMVFKKGEKLRKFYKCTLIENNKPYRVNGLAKVVVLSN